MAQIGKVLWWDEEEGLGVIKDIFDNEVVFDSSVVFKLVEKSIIDGMFILFEYDNTSINKLYASQVKVPKKNEIKKVILNYEKQRQVEMPFEEMTE
jgi:hypothetical protein